PVDTTYVTEEQFARCAGVLAADPGVDFVFSSTMSLLHDFDRLAPLLGDAARTAGPTGGRVAVTTLSQDDGFSDRQRHMLGAAGVLVLPSIERGIKTAAACARAAEPPPTEAASLVPVPIDPGLSFAAASALPLPASRICRSLSEAKRFCAEIDY